MVTPDPRAQRRPARAHETHAAPAPRQPDQRREANEIILLNSHDGTSSYQMLAGMFRFVCSNGLVCGDTVADVRVPHKGDVAGHVIEGAYQVLSGFERVQESRDPCRPSRWTPGNRKCSPAPRWPSSTTTQQARAHHGIANPDAAPLRRPPPRPVERVQPHAGEPDQGRIAWPRANGRRQQTRPVQGIDSDIRLNRALWLLADGMRPQSLTPSTCSPPEGRFPLHSLVSLDWRFTMNAVTHTEARALDSRANVLQAADPTKNLILVPLSRLVLRPTGRNVRKTPRMSIPELAASIQRVGLLQNLIVIPAADGEHYEVVAGGRRLAALKLLAKKHRIAKDWDVPCLLVADGTARTASLTENVQREAMHPADQFEAFAALVAEGRPIEDIAADFSVTPLVVQRRLKLANVSPRLMADYRADAVSLDQLMALAITDDHAAQEAAFYDAPQWQRHPRTCANA
jgi:ParB/RepB/Spo0J family partition protein